METRTSGSLTSFQAVLLLLVPEHTLSGKQIEGQKPGNQRKPRKILLPAMWSQAPGFTSLKPFLICKMQVMLAPVSEVWVWVK